MFVFLLLVFVSNNRLKISAIGIAGDAEVVSKVTLLIANEDTERREKVISNGVNA